MLPLRTQQLSVPQLPFGEVPLAYGLRREVKNLTLSAVTHVPAVLERQICQRLGSLVLL